MLRPMFQLFDALSRMSKPPKGPTRRDYVKPTNALICAECDYAEPVRSRRVRCKLFPYAKPRRPEWPCVDEAERVKKERFAKMGRG